MKFLLLNKNPIVKKLVSLSTTKAGVEADYYENIEDVPSFDYDYIFVDDELLSDETISDLRGKSKAKLGCFISKERESPKGFDLCIQKPFLPTELVELLSEKADDAQTNDKGPAIESIDKEMLGDSLVEDIDDLDLEEDKIQSDAYVDHSLDEDIKEPDLNSLEEDLNIDEDMDRMSLDDKTEVAKEDIGDTKESSGELDGVGELTSEAVVDEDNLTQEEPPIEERSLLEDTDEPILDEIEQQEEIPQEEESREDMMDDTLGGVLNSDDISEIKGLLEENEEIEEVANEDLMESIKGDDTDKIKVDEELELGNEAAIDEGGVKLENSELASLTEEALSEALGEEIQDEEMVELDSDIKADSSSFTETSITPESKSAPLKSENITSMINSLEIEKLKELLDGVEIKITINFPKKI